MVGVTDGPDPFDPDEESNELEVVVDYVVPSPARAGSHIVFLERAILDPVQRTSVVRVFGVSAFDPGDAVNGVVRTSVSNVWDGSDGTEVLLPRGMAYPFDATVFVARIPEDEECENDETLRQFSFDEVHVVEPIINAPLWWANNPICCAMAIYVKEEPIDVFAISGLPYYIAKELRCATTCADAVDQCNCTDWENRFGAQSCTYCFETCTDPNPEDEIDPPDRWPGNDPGLDLPCDYWKSNYNSGRNAVQPCIPVVFPP